MRFALSAFGKRLLLVAALLVATAAVGRLGVTTSAERALQDVSFGMREHAASGQLHIVEMDAASIAEIERWPWSRSHYGRVVDQLNEAGVRSIVFDVDFSAPSTPAEDAAFAAAVARSRARIVLPTFAQQAGFESARSLDALPIPMLRRHAILGSVSVIPDADGLVRRMPAGTVTDGLPRPTLSAQIAQQSGTAGEYFPIDFAIDPATIPRHSFIAVERGRIDPATLAGKDVLIGATAIELFDRYATPRHGVLPGVVVQALASETLYRGMPRGGHPLLPLLLAAVAAFLLLGADKRSSLLIRFSGGVAMVFALNHFSYALQRVYFEMAPAAFLLVAALALQTTIVARRHLRQKRLVDIESGLPNQHGFAQSSHGEAQTYTISAKITGFDALKSVLGSEQIGDLINRLADRLRSEGCGPTIYRPDERVLAWNSDARHYDLENHLAGLKAIMRHPVEVKGRRVDVTVVFGIANIGSLAEATHAASIAQNRGLGWHYHQEAERAAIEQQASLMGELDAAIGSQALQVFYQPKLHLRSDCITSVEALVRWNHPERGFLRPDTFIPLAERNDRIADLTLFVLRQTIADLLQWCARGLVLKAAVNISARLVTSQEFLLAAEHVIRTTGVPRDRLIFEVTESATMSDPEIAVAALERFAAMGIGISMDDYGTGQSSLTYLRRLPLSELKIDRSFVQHAHRDKNDALVVRSTIELAHSLGLQVVAEGVEDAECLAFLRAAGCDFAQGYYVGKPMKDGELALLVSEQATQAA